MAGAFSDDSGSSNPAQRRLDRMDQGMVCREVCFSYAAAVNTAPLIIDHLNHCFERGEITLVTGATGCGKSTLIHLLAGLMRPSEGQIVVDGRPISRWISRHLDLWRREVGLVFQEPQLIPDLTLLENVIAPLVPLDLSMRSAQDRAGALLERLDIGHLRHQPVKKLSGGERQRTTLARALIAQPLYLLADELTAFQDSAHVSAIKSLLVDQRAKGACIVVCSHDDRLVKSSIFNDVFQLAGGRLESVGSCGIPC